jgi:hypothetical protein
MRSEDTGKTRAEIASTGGVIKNILLVAGELERRFTHFLTLDFNEHDDGLRRRFAPIIRITSHAFDRYSWLREVDPVCIVLAGNEIPCETEVAQGRFKFITRVVVLEEVTAHSLKASVTGDSEEEKQRWSL